MEKNSVFQTLSKIDVSGHVEEIYLKKNNKRLSYLSWSWAWNTLKNIYPDTPTPKVTKFQEMVLTENGFQMTERQVPYLTTPLGTMVEVTVNIAGDDYTQSLYVMDAANRIVKYPDLAQINKTTQRCLVKAIAMAGLGLNIYAGEDLPMGDVNTNDTQKAVTKARTATYNQTIAKVAKASGETVESLNKLVKENISKDKRFKTANAEEKLIMAINFANQLLESEKKDDD